MLGVIGRVQLERGLLEDAEVSLDDAVIAYARLPRVLPGHAVALGDRAMVAYERGNAVDALRRLRLADQVAADAGLDPNDTRRIYLQVRLAEMQVETDQPTLAEASARVALARIAAAGAGDTLIHPDALCALATALHHQSRAEEALPVLQEAEALQLRIAPSHPKMAVILNDLGVLQARLGRREEADATMLRAVERHEAIYGATHPQTVRTRGNRASLLRAFRGPAVSAREYERVLPAAREAFGGSGHAQLVNMLAQLAVSLDEAGEGDKALLAAREAWAMQSALPDEQRAPNDWVAGVLGVMLFERGDATAPDLLREYDPPTCSALERRTGFSQRFCIARALVEADGGRCEVPSAQPPVAASLEGRARDWWAAWWWLRARCNADADADAAADALATRAAQGDVPDWLATRVAAAPDAD
jgi:tetratricopeptide (TPR) repeat protein